MSSLINRLRKLFLLLALSFLLTTACYNTATQNVDTLTGNSSNCREVQHKLGTVCIPTESERIIALDPRYIADPLLSLGIQPVGMAITTDTNGGQEGLGGLTPGIVEAVVRVGNVYSPSLERILGLKPDLIIAMDFAHEAIYEQLSAIAPTVLLQYEAEDKEYTSFKVNLQRIAQIVDKEAEADKVIAQYQDRIEQLRQQLGRQPEDIEVTVLIYYGGTFFIPWPIHPTHEIFSDIGLTDNTDSARTSGISLEVIDQYDGDILFIINYDREGEDFFLENPLIASLEAVKNGQVHFVDTDKWSASGPIGVNRMLDDLFTYLPNDT